jgi:hypothetical protein
VKKLYITLVAAVLLLLPACVVSDTVSTEEARAFSKLPLATEGADNAWYITDFSNVMIERFAWGTEDAQIRVAAGSFINAGLDTSKLTNFSEGYLYYGAKQIGTTSKLALTPYKDFETMLSKKQDALEYNSETGRYFLNLGDGNSFMWAKTSAGTEDIAFVINPEPLIAAGLQPENVAGWAYTQFSEQGVQQWRLFKAFDLEES